MSRDWIKSFFREEIFTPGSPEANAAAADEVRFLWKALRLKKGSRVLDVACGTGRHALRLARRGADVTGMDITTAYLRDARRAAKSVPGVRFIRGDMRRLPYKAEFDAAINLWTSFGYFEDPTDDLRTLRAVARALKPGGLFLIDLINYEAAKNSGLTKNWIRRDDGAYVLEEMLFVGGWDPKTVNEWTVLRPGKPALRSRFVVRGYDQARLHKILRQARLTPLKTWSSMGPDNRPPGSAGSRLVVLSRKT